MPPAFLLSSGLPGAVPLDLSQGSSQGSCQCWQQHGEDTAVFYNRVPKCGSTTMLRCASTLSAPSEPSAPLCSPLQPLTLEASPFIGAEQFHRQRSAARQGVRLLHVALMRHGERDGSGTDHSAYGFLRRYVATLGIGGGWNWGFELGVGGEASQGRTLPRGPAPGSRAVIIVRARGCMLLWGVWVRTGVVIEGRPAQGLSRGRSAPSAVSRSHAKGTQWEILVSYELGPPTEEASLLLEQSNIRFALGCRRAPGGDGGALRPRRPKTGVGIIIRY